ncbi:MAG: YkvA family protein [Acidimicrobiales bacterium]
MERQEALERARSLLGSIPNLGKLFFRLAKDPRVPRRSKLIFGGIALYLLVPFDVVPDWIPGIGQVDDLILIALALDAMLNRVPQEVVSEHWDGDPELLATIQRVLATATVFVPKSVKRWVLTPEE